MAYGQFTMFTKELLLREYPKKAPWLRTRRGNRRPRLRLGRHVLAVCSRLVWLPKEEEDEEEEELGARSRR